MSSQTASVANSDRLWSVRQIWLLAVVLLAVGGHFATATLQTWLGQPELATSLISPATHQRLMLAANVPFEEINGSRLYDVPWSLPTSLTLPFLLLAIVVGGVICSLWPSTESLSVRWARWCAAVGLGALAIGAWDWIWLIAVLTLGDNGAVLMAALIPFWMSVVPAAVLTWGLPLAMPRPQEPLSVARAPTSATSSRNRWRAVWLGVAIYVLIFTTLNWRLWFNLRLPHGDSAMYEEHLWNLLHGKGFRSYLDQGLFLGEHIQVVHLALLPLYVLWPSHLLLEGCESAALALGAFPVAWLTLRHTGSRSAAVGVAVAYLLYAPMQFLDIEIDLKTFRPEAFGIPLFLLTLDQLDRGRWRGCLWGLAACLTVKEDYALLLSPLGVWIAATAWQQTVGPQSPLVPGRIAGKRWLWTGLGLMVFGVIYLWLATRVVMPWFRTGAEIHYASYFTKLGDSPEAIVRTVLFRPVYVAGLLFNLSTLLYALALLVPVGGVALLSPGRLAVGLPLFGILCLNELARDPRHQFHAPLVAIVFWATAAGLGQIPAYARRWRRRELPADTATTAKTLAARETAAGANTAEALTATDLARGARWVWTSSLATGLWFCIGPTGVTFWDSGSAWYWATLYGPSPRGAAFAQLEGTIPRTARVASTDFVHPRFTHYERSYDYSEFARKVSGYELRVPDDTQYIVIDTHHPYSRYRTAADIPEFHQPERWELLPDRTNGLFLVLKRRDPSPTAAQATAPSAAQD